MDVSIVVVETLLIYVQSQESCTLEKFFLAITKEHYHILLIFQFQYCFAQQYGFTAFLYIVCIHIYITDLLVPVLFSCVLVWCRLQFSFLHSLLCLVKFVGQPKYINVLIFCVLYLDKFYGGRNNLFLINCFMYRTITACCSKPHIKMMQSCIGK